MNKKKISRPYSCQPSINSNEQCAKEPMMEYQVQKRQLSQDVKESIDISLEQIARGEAVDADVVMAQLQKKVKL